MIDLHDIADGDLVIVSSLNNSPYYAHAAVYAGGRFYHFSESGAHCDSYDFFIVQPDRRIFRVEHGTRSAKEIEAYYEANKWRNWDRLTYNCEHFAYGAAFGAEKSPTLRGYMALAFTLVGSLAAILMTIKRRRI